MKQRPSTCPPMQMLADFGLGKLDAPSESTVQQHLETCADCRRYIAGVSGDTFLSRLLAKRPAASIDQSTSISISPHDTSDPRTAPETSRVVKLPQDVIRAIPRELAEHPDYEVLKELGRGGMGVVYLARNRMMDRLEVLKIVNRKLLNEPRNMGRFQQEIRAAARLRHPNIVAAHSVLRIGELLALAMEYVKGEDLSQLVRRCGPLPIVNATLYIRQVALGLQHAHERGMVHRDIKPNNLMLAMDGKKHVVKILDFGLAKATSEKRGDAGLTRTGQMLGTPHYIAPEQTLDAQRAGIQADVYSLGCTLYFLLAGRPPFDGNSLFEILRAHHTDEATPLDRLRSDVPEELAATVARMMAKEPDERYQTPREVAKALTPFFKPGVAGAASHLPIAAAPSELVMSSPPQARLLEPVGGEQLVEGPATVGAEDSRADISGLAAKASPEQKSSKSAPTKGRRKLPWRLFGFCENGDRKPPRMLIAVGGGMLAPLLFLSAFFFVRVKTPDGVVTIKVNEPYPEVLVDGDRVTMSWEGGGKRAEFHVQPGSHKIEFVKEGFKAVGEEIEIEDGGRRMLVARLEANAAPAAAPDTEVQRVEEKTPVARLKESLEDYSWRYFDNLYPGEGELVRFYKNGTFNDRWKWHYWIAGPGAMDIQFWDALHDPDHAIHATFNKELTEFRATFTDEKNRSHEISGIRVDALSRD